MTLCSDGKVTDLFSRYAEFHSWLYAEVVELANNGPFANDVSGVDFVLHLCSSQQGRRAVVSASSASSSGSSGSSASLASSSVTSANVPVTSASVPVTSVSSRSNKFLDTAFTALAACLSTPSLDEYRKLQQRKRLSKQDKYTKQELYKSLLTSYLELDRRLHNWIVTESPFSQVQTLADFRYGLLGEPEYIEENVAAQYSEMMYDNIIEPLKQDENVHWRFYNIIEHMYTMLI